MKPLMILIALLCVGCGEKVDECAVVTGIEAGRYVSTVRVVYGVSSNGQMIPVYLPDEEWRSARAQCKCVLHNGKHTVEINGDSLAIGDTILITIPKEEQ